MTDQDRTLILKAIPEKSIVRIVKKITDGSNIIVEVNSKVIKVRDGRKGRMLIEYNTRLIKVPYTLVHHESIDIAAKLLNS